MPALDAKPWSECSERPSEDKAVWGRQQLQAAPPPGAAHRGMVASCWFPQPFAGAGMIIKPFCFACKSCE